MEAWGDDFRVNVLRGVRVKLSSLRLHLGGRGLGMGSPVEEGLSESSAGSGVAPPPPAVCLRLHCTMEVGSQSLGDTDVYVARRTDTGQGHRAEIGRVGNKPQN